MTEDRMITDEKPARRKPWSKTKRQLTPPGDDYVAKKRDADIRKEKAEAKMEDSVETIPPETAPAQRSRKVEEKRERRRRDTEIDGARMRLSIPHRYKNDPDYEYRWINDDKARVENLTVRDDWDIVKADDIDSHHSGANTVRRQVGVKADGSALFAQLVRKPREFCETDRAKTQSQLDETMAAVTAKRKRGDPVSFGGQTGYVAADTSFRDE